MKISVLFKPSRQSWINSDLTYLWCYWITFNKLNKIDYKFLKKVKVEDIPYDELWYLYEKCDEYFNKNATVILMTSISNLFES
jgi:hypothetical protein